MTTITSSDNDLRSTTIDDFLAAVRSGDGIPLELYAPDAELDATVPNWRFSRHGAAEIAGVYAGWFADPAEMEELERMPNGTGEVVRYLLTWRQDGVPHAAHHVHLLTLDSSGRIDKDVVFCGGRWDATLLAQIGEANR
jgi:hypothetical protein